MYECAECITNMLSDLKQQPLQERRKHQCLAMFYKVVEGLVPAIAPSDYLMQSNNMRQIRAKQYNNFVRYDIVER